MADKKIRRWPARGMTARLAVALLLGTTLQACSSAPESPRRWTEFVKVRGHAEEIPKVWVQTEAGRLAHDIVLPASLPKPVPFDFEAARLKAMSPFGKTPDVATQYWQHLCATEAGQFIFKKVGNVEGFAYMRMSPQTDESAADEDPWMYEAPGFEITEVFKEGKNVAGWYISNPWATYLRVELPIGKTNRWERIWRTGNEPDLPVDRDAIKEWTFTPIAAPTERYAVTWRGIRRPLDRENRLAGNELIIFERTNGEVLAAIRDFALAPKTGKFKYGVMWRNLRTCQEFSSMYSENKGNRFYIFAPRVLVPTRQPLRLKNNDQRVIELNDRRRK